MELQIRKGRDGRGMTGQTAVIAAALVLLLCGCQDRVRAGDPDGMGQGIVAGTSQDGCEGTGVEAAFDRIECGEGDGVPATGPDLVWTRQDLDGDGQEELILLRRWDEKDPEQPIERIYAYRQGRAEEVFSDLNDLSEYHFISGNGNIIYSADDYGQIDVCYHARVCCNSQWDLQPQEKLYVYYFYGSQAYSEDEMAHLRETFPETYGAHGRGIYCFWEYPAAEDAEVPEGGHFDPETGWVRVPMSKEGFLEAFYKMTGEDFWAHRPDWKVRFDEPQEDIADETAYQEFLEGRRKLYGWE